MPDYTQSRDEMLLEVDRIIAEHGPDFQLWLADQRLEVTDGTERVHWGSLTSTLRAQGKLKAAEDWIRAQKGELALRWMVTRRNRVAGEICRRFVEVKMKGVAPTPKVALAAPYSPETDILPEYQRWVMRHPGLVPNAEEEDDTVLKSRVLLYERANPAPGQEALNLLRHCQKDKTARQKMFDEAKVYIVESRKKKKETVGESDVKEQARVLDMQAELAKMVART